MSLPRPHSPYFLVKVAIKDEKKRKEKVGSIFVAPSQTFMAYNTQVGEIVSIGEGASAYFPEAKIGHLLLMHHFVQNNSTEEAKEEHLIHWDEEYNYYVVTAYEFNGKNCETYGIWDGENIIPNKDYIFLKTIVPIHKDLPPDELINQQLSVSKHGILLFENWTDSRESKEAKMAEVKKEVESLSKSGTNKRHVQQGIADKEAEMNKMSADINKQKYLPYTVSYANNGLSNWFDRPIKEGDTLYMLNIACSTEIKFNDVSYIVTKIKFIGCLFDGKPKPCPLT